ncbi:hypothetical protein K435DRAFT_865933 [Dendrothele bispora CBS 962.96]|uniref:Uncharacterized protein n=1 Tax=Dendrothele bispora (strain CBS 962.96) TaxID=1314807 RepID=A0A4S8LIX3_DENBC|nr:hypothetical protein K435DRAFT_865933 [Dendrothele bispora CBS 962.96]
MVFDSSEDEYEPSQPVSVPTGLPIKRKHSPKEDEDFKNSDTLTAIPAPLQPRQMAKIKGVQSLIPIYQKNYSEFEYRLFVAGGMLDDVTDSQTWVEQYTSSSGHSEKPNISYPNHDSIKREPSASPSLESVSNPSSTPRRKRAITPLDYPESQLPETWSNCSNSSPVRGQQNADFPGPSNISDSALEKLDRSELIQFFRQEVAKYQQELAEYANQHFHDIQKLQNRIEDKTQAAYASEAWAKKQGEKCRAAELKVQELSDTLSKLKTELGR